jgi:hypothetical protein
MFDPTAHLLKLPRRVKDKATGHYTTVYDDYLEVKWRLVMFRERYPHGVITTEEIYVDLDRGYARYKATVADGEGGQATGYGTETAADFADYVERAETRALGRALAVLGFGTPFVGQDLTEGDHVADAPVASTTGQTPAPVTSAVVEADVPDVPPPASNGHAPPPLTIPAGLPCAGQAITALQPAQLRMLLSKVDQLAGEQGRQWQPLLEALAAEREARLQAGQRPTLVAVEGGWPWSLAAGPPGPASSAR